MYICIHVHILTYERDTFYIFEIMEKENFCKVKATFREEIILNSELIVLAKNVYLRSHRYKYEKPENYYWKKNNIKTRVLMTFG